MADWRNKFGKSSAQEEPEDFILLREDEKETEESLHTTQSLPTEEIKNATDKLNDTGEIPPLYSGGFMADSSEYESYAPKQTASDSIEKVEYDLNDADAPEKKNSKNSRKKWFIGGGIGVAAIALIVVLFMILAPLTNPLRGYSQVEVVKGNVIDTLGTEGTLEENARYAITSLVSGKITESKPEVGDTVTTSTVLYKLDDTEAKLAVERAKNQLSRSKAGGTTTGTDRIYSTAAGNVHTVNIRSGSNVSYGQVVATIKQADGTIVAVTSPFSGKVSSVSAKQGGSIAVNGIIATVASSSSQGGTVYDQKSSELEVKSAEAVLENYTIKSPVNGVIVEKNVKAGDNVGIANTDNPMMVILDTNSMKFTFRVDEYTVNSLEVGMPVVVNTESIPNESFAGEISRISYEGIPNEEGKVMFEAEITIEEPGDLKTGMKVTAKIILDSATNVVYVPHQALMEADGETALVLVKETSNAVPELTIPTASSTIDGALDEELAYPWIDVPKGCKLVRVEYGVADDTNVEILSGLRVGDIVVFDPESQPVELSPSASASPADAETDELDALFGEMEDEEESDTEDTPSASSSAAPNASSTAAPDASSTEKPKASATKAPNQISL